MKVGKRIRQKKMDEVKIDADIKLNLWVCNGEIGLCMRNVGFFGSLWTNENRVTTQIFDIKMISYEMFLIVLKHKRENEIKKKVRGKH